MSASNFLIGWPNRVDASTLSGPVGAWENGLPLTNLQTRDSSQVARSTDATTARTKFTITQSGEVRVVSLFRTNLSQNAQWRVTIGALYDTGWMNAYQATYTTDYRLDPVVVIPAGYNAASVAVEIDDTTNPDGYVQLARVFIGGGFQPEHNASYGLQDGLIDYSTVQRLESGAAFYYARDAARTVRFALDALSQADEYQTVRNMLRTVGTAGEVFYAPWPGQPARLQNDGFLATFRQLAPIEYPYYQRRRIGIELVEVL